MASSTYTCAVLACRKLLMHIAVEKGAQEGKRFVEYVAHLVDAGYAPPGSEPWVKHVKDRGNEANHVIVHMDREAAEELVSFLELLMTFVYELPARTPGAGTADMS